MKRRVGTSTVLVDRFVQELFNNGFSYVYEPAYRGTQIADKLNKNVLNILLNRMKLEHPHINLEYKYDSVDGIDCYKVKIVL